MNRINGNTQYYYAQNKAYEVLLKYSDGMLPINPFQIIKQVKNIKLVTYTELAKELQLKNPELSLEEIKCQFESDKGFLKKKGKKKYILAYNEQDDVFTLRWTLFHELGHYFLDHLKDDNTILFSNVETYEMAKEREANCFAKHCIVPLPVLQHYINLTNDIWNVNWIIRDMFSTSDSVANYIEEHFENYRNYYKPSNHKKLIKKFFNPFRLEYRANRKENWI